MHSDEEESFHSSAANGAGNVALSQLDRGGFWSLLPLGYADKDALALVQTHDACPLKRGDVHEDIVSAAVPDDETEPLRGVVPLHRPHLLGARLQGLSV
jgi:hypothetical protein